MVIRPSPFLVYNASDSAPRGLYVVSPATNLRIGDYVVARLPRVAAELAAGRGYLPRSVPVLKQIVALAHQWICVKDGRVHVDETMVTPVLPEDGNRRPLKPWDGCRRLLPGEVFLLNVTNPASFDSRYFGPIDMSFVLGRATHW
jgi:conjugative transfer signal peptidase TraF